MNDCLFCKIINKEIPAAIRYEDDRFMAFDDINPKAKVHILLIPKKHISSIAALDESDSSLIGQMVLLAKKIAEDSGIAEGFRLVFNSGADSGQEVDHLHMHILGGNRLGPIA